MKSRKKSDPQNKTSKCFLFDDHYIVSHNLSTWLCINVVRRKLMLVTDLRVEKLEALLVCGLLERKYYCMRNFYYLIGLQRLYFSSIWNTYLWKLQLTFAGSSINKDGHDLYVIFGINITRDISKLSQLLRIAISKYHSRNLCQISSQIMLLPIETARASASVNSVIYIDIEPMFAPCKGIQDSLRFWIPRHRFRILSVGFRILCQLNWDSGFQSLVGLRIP